MGFDGVLFLVAGKLYCQVIPVTGTAIFRTSGVRMFEVSAAAFTIAAVRPKITPIAGAILRGVVGFLIVGPAVINCGAQSQPICPRPVAGGTVTAPPELKSHNGLLEVSLHFRYEAPPPSQGPPRYCYVTDDGLESPTLRVFPGDELIIHLHNDLSPGLSGPAMRHSAESMTEEADCNAAVMDSSVTNLHFHGMSIPPICHEDDVIHTAIQAGHSFDYQIHIPEDQPPGLYWYHPHPHGFSERQIQGGASGALIVEGIESAVPAVADLPQRLLLLRDQQRIGPQAPGLSVPTWDISVNFVPITYPDNKAASMTVTAGSKELWRVVNAASNTIFDVQVLIEGIAQPLQIVAIDGVPVATSVSQPPTMRSKLLLPPGARAEFVVSTPAKGHSGEFVTRAWSTGPAGDNDTERAIARIISAGEPDPPVQKSPSLVNVPKRNIDRVEGIDKATQRRLYFSQRSSNPQDPDNFVLYFVTVDGQSPAPYKMSSPPNIVVHQGDVEDWTIENRSTEDHVFHIHQVHFTVMRVDGTPVNDPTKRDTIDIPYWSGRGPYPSVMLRMDFSDPKIVGTFLYHCHILKHEDMGMMGSVQVVARPPR
jgi:FtsP/CotA-like multicopper oxidase with cupredoxin domain